MEEENNRANESVRVSDKKDNFLPISILIAAIVIGGAILLTVFYKPGTSVAPTAGGNDGGVAAQEASTTANPAAIMTLGPRDAILGNTNAPVTIIEYGDYQCPFCNQFFSQTEPLIVQNYVNTGKARMVFRDFAFLGAESTAAAEAAQCAEDQNKLWSYHDALYAAKVQDEQKGGAEDDGFFTTALFLKLGQQVGLNMATFTSCVTNNTDAGIVAQEKAAATAAGVDSTPTFFINGQQILGAQPYSQFQSTIDALL